MTLSSGTRLGPYEIIEPLGAGGMGEVYKSRDTRLARTVAVKVVSASLASDPAWRQRFDREARILATLSNPHICPIFDVGSHDGVDFLVMEYLDGETLAARLARGPLPVDLALRHAIEIADALAAAHREGVCHRDLKPGNIMLTRSRARLRHVESGGDHRLQSSQRAVVPGFRLRRAGDAGARARPIAPGDLASLAAFPA
jgi:serine/threonine protein kinase